MSSLQARTFTRTSGTAVNYAARLELLEQYLAHHEDIVRCAQASLDWLALHAGVKQSACLAVDADSNMLVGIAARGTVGEDIELFSWPLSDTHVAANAEGFTPNACALATAALPTMSPASYQAP